jgi:hypothetical protein
MPCQPNSPDCPCNYVRAQPALTTTPAAGAGQCLICPDVPNTANDAAPPLDPCNNAQGCPGFAPGVFYGDCTNPNFLNTPAGSFPLLKYYGNYPSGPVACVGQPGVYYVSGVRGTNQLACFDYNGYICEPGAPNCPCDYLHESVGNATAYASPTETRGSYQCVVCPPVQSVPLINQPSPPPPPPQTVKFGKCTSIFSTTFVATPPPVTAGGWTGPVTCTTDPTQRVYYPGDGNDAGASLSCYNSFGAKCVPGTAGCPCVYKKVYSTTSAGVKIYATANASNPDGQCLICPSAPVVTAQPPGVLYGSCSAQVFQQNGITVQRSGAWSGVAYCAGLPNAYYVGDANDGGASLSCFNYAGQKCAPGTLGCPCQYGPPNNAGKVAWAGNPGGGNCLVCPPIPYGLASPPPLALPPAPAAPATNAPPRPSPPPSPPPPRPPPPRPPPPPSPPPCMYQDGYQPYCGNMQAQSGTKMCVWPPCQWSGGYYCTNEYNYNWGQVNDLCATRVRAPTLLPGAPTAPRGRATHAPTGPLPDPCHRTPAARSWKQCYPVCAGCSAINAWGR